MALFPTSSPTKYVQKALKVQFIAHTDIVDDTKGKTSTKIWVGEKKNRSPITQSALNSDDKFAEVPEIQTS